MIFTLLKTGNGETISKAARGKTYTSGNVDKDDGRFHFKNNPSKKKMEQNLVH